jgi:hypothetical protein
LRCPTAARRFFAVEEVSNAVAEATRSGAIFILAVEREKK